jgi:hypothetical protein
VALSAIIKIQQGKKMRIYKTKNFAKWAKKEGLRDKALCEAVTEMERGLVDANLGDCVYKKRVALSGQGKRGGARTLLAYKAGNKAFFIFGFAKSELDNITDEQLRRLKTLARLLMEYTEQALQKALDEREIKEVNHHE